MALCDSEINITWIIENYLLYDGRISSRIVRTPELYTDMKEKAFVILLDLAGNNPDSEGCVSIGMAFKDWEQNQIPSSVNIIFFNSDNEIIGKLDEKKVKYIPDDEDDEIWDAYMIPKVVEIKELENKIKDSTNDTIVIKLNITMENATKSDRINKTVKTTIDFDKFSFNWYELDQQASVDLRKDDTISYEMPFEIDVKNPEDDILIEIKRNEKHANHYPKVKCQVSLMQDTDEIFSRVDFFIFEDKSLENNIWHFPSFIKKSFLNANRSDDPWLLKIDFFVSNCMFRNRTIEGPKTLIKASDIPVIDSLQNDFQAMFSDKKYTDVKILINKEVLNVHKSILSSRSPVFSAMLDQDMTEGQTGMITISDIDADTMKMFLTFLYSGKLADVDCEKLLELLLVAEKYQVLSLKEKCCEILTSRLNTDNICEIVSVADMVEHANLKTAAMKYIKENAAEILSSPKWSEWIVKNVKLGSEIFLKFSDIIKASN